VATSADRISARRRHERPDLVPTKTAANLLGHSTVGFFLDVYVHPSENGAAADVIGAAMESGSA
jgi:hypothetical protein